MKSRLKIFLGIGLLVLIFVFLGINLTGKVVSVGPFWSKEEVYTASEVDNLIKNFISNKGTHIYYTKSEIDNLFKNIAQNKTIVTQTNDNYTKSEVDFLLNKINVSAIGISSEFFNSCELYYDDFNKEYFANANSCSDVCKNSLQKNCLIAQTFYSSTGNYNGTTSYDSNNILIPCNLFFSELEDMFGSETPKFYDVDCICCD